MQRDEELPTPWGRARSSGELGEWVAQGRRGKGLTQAEFAQWLGVDGTTVIRMEAGAVTQIARVIDALSVLGMDLVVVPRGVKVSVGPPGTDPTP